jgi:hypothetical protein
MDWKFVEMVELDVGEEPEHTTTIVIVDALTIHRPQLLGYENIQAVSQSSTRKNSPGV